MGSALAGASRAARDVFDEVDEALRQNLFRLMRDGPGDELKLTENAQPAIMANAIAVFRTMGVRLADVANFVAGHSLGEYSALCAAGSFDLSTTAKLLKLRGQAMQQAVPVGEGAMAALLGADLALAQKIADAAAQGEVCTVANDNDPSQVVISGSKFAIDRAIEIAKEMGAKRAIALPVSAPFHCALMQPAAEAMRDALSYVVLEAPAVPVGVGAMAALLGADLELAQKIADAAAQGEVCTVANDNDPSQVVISGHKGAIDRAIELAKEMGAKRAIPLPVSAPFHCPLMQPAAEAMRDALSYVLVAPPAVPLYANVTAQAVTDPDTIRNQLVEQVTGMVRWRESVANMAAAGVDEFVELGGKVLGPMVKRIAPEAKMTSVVTIEDVEALAKEIA